MIPIRRLLACRLFLATGDSPNVLPAFGGREQHPPSYSHSLFEHVYERDGFLGAFGMGFGL